MGGTSETVGRFLWFCLPLDSRAALRLWDISSHMTGLHSDLIDGAHTDETEHDVT